MALPPFLAALDRNDPEFAQAIEKVHLAAMGPGALDKKTKLLIALAVDAVRGASQGVASIARQVRALGTSEAEIQEALRIAYSTSGNSILLCSMAAFPNEDNVK